MASNKNGRILIVGESLVDVVHTTDGNRRAHPGGSPANVALTLGRLGNLPRFATCLGDDDNGRQIRDWLSASNVTVDATLRPPIPTSLATSRLERDGSARYEFDIDWNPGTPDLGSSRLVHTGSIATQLAPGAEQVLHLVEAARSQATITYDPNLRPTVCPDRSEVRRRVEQFVGLADVVKASDEDLAWLYPAQEPIEVLHQWSSAGPAVVVGTFGPHGAVVVVNGSETTLPGQKVDVVDTIGAGDAFMGGLIHGLLAQDLDGADRRPALRDASSRDLMGVIEFATSIAAMTVARSGANPPSIIELVEQDVALGNPHLQARDC